MQALKHIRSDLRIYVTGHCALEFILRAARAQRRRAPEVDRERYRAPRRILNCKTIHIH